MEVEVEHDNVSILADAPFSCIQPEMIMKGSCAIVGWKQTGFYLSFILRPSRVTRCWSQAMTLFYYSWKGWSSEGKGEREKEKQECTTDDIPTSTCQITYSIPFTVGSLYISVRGRYPAYPAPPYAYVEWGSALHESQFEDGKDEQCYHVHYHWNGRQG